MLGSRLLLPLALVVSLPAWGTSSDFDNDSSSEVVLVEIQSDQSLEFNAYNLKSSASTSLGTIGEAGDHVIMAHWLGNATPEIGVVSETVDHTLEWSIIAPDQSVIKKTFGTSGNTVVSGGDFNGNGIADAVVVDTSGRKLKWQVAFDLFTANSSTSEFTFGFNNEAPFFIPGTGGDLIATFLKNRAGGLIRTKSTQTNATRRFRIAAISSTDLPQPLHGNDGAWLVSAAQSGNSTVLSFRPLFKGATRFDATVPITGTVIIGDFSSSLGEEVAIHSGDTLYIYDRATGQTTNVVVGSGIPVDEINVNTLGDSSDGGSGTPIAPPVGSPELSNVCASITAISPGEMLIKSEASKHINNGDLRASGYTVVCAAQCPVNVKYAPFFYANGELAGAVAKYGLFSGNHRPRMYGAVGQAPQHNAGQIAQKARSIGSGKLYLQISAATSGAETVCKEFNPTGRNGSL